MIIIIIIMIKKLMSKIKFKVMKVAKLLRSVLFTLGPGLGPIVQTR